MENKPGKNFAAVNTTSIGNYNANGNPNWTTFEAKPLFKPQDYIHLSPFPCGEDQITGIRYIPKFNSSLLPSKYTGVIRPRDTKRLYLNTTLSTIPTDQSENME